MKSKKHFEEKDNFIVFCRWIHNDEALSTFFPPEVYVRLCTGERNHNKRLNHENLLNPEENLKKIQWSVLI